MDNSIDTARGYDLPTALTTVPQNVCVCVCVAQTAHSLNSHSQPMYDASQTVSISSVSVLGLLALCHVRKSLKCDTWAFKQLTADYIDQSITNSYTGPSNEITSGVIHYTGEQ